MLKYECYRNDSLTFINLEERILLRRLWWWKIQALNESGKNLQGDINWEEIEINCEFYDKDEKYTINHNFFYMVVNYTYIFLV